MKASVVAVGIAIAVIATPLCAERMPAPKDAQTCHPLLLASECKTLRDQLAGAKTPAEREVLITDYRFLIADREQACACKGTLGIAAATWKP